jgi:hypothetical protein
MHRTTKKRKWQRFQRYGEREFLDARRHHTRYLNETSLSHTLKSAPHMPQLFFKKTLFKNQIAPNLI